MINDDERLSSDAVQPVKVAIVGAGNMSRHHARAFASIDGVELVGISSRTRTKAEALAVDFEIATIADTVNELYERTHADIVVVSVSVLAIPEVTEKCMDYPWVILAEKPLGLSLNETERIARLTEAKSARVHVALNRRHYSSTIEAHRLLEDQPGPRFIHVMDQEDQIAARQGGHPNEVVDRFMYANSIHLVDYFSIFGRGDVVSVDPLQPWNPDKPGVVIATIKFDSGDLGLYHAVWNGPGPWSVSVGQGDLRIEMRPLEELSYQKAGSRESFSVPRTQEDIDFKPGLFNQAHRIVEMIKKNRDEPASSIGSVLKTVRMVSNIYGV